MSHRMYVAVVSLGSASLGLLAASITLHALGCGPSANDLFNTKGTCVALPNDTSPKCICSTAADCPKATACMDWMCDNTNHCKASFPTGTPLVINQAQGDCKRVECTAGEQKTVDDNSDLPASPKACMSVTCMNGEPHEAPLDVGAACNEGQNKTCNGMGSCVLCVENTNSGCGPNEICHKPGSGDLKCVHHCVDGTKNAGETDVDCGGSCKQCDLGGGCSGADDCSNHTCAPSNVCCESACSGPCRICAAGTGQCEDVPTGNTYGTCIDNGKSCAQGVGCVIMSGWPCFQDDDCMSHVCVGIVQKTCSKGLNGRPCVSSNDCEQGCDLTTHICQ